MAKKGTRMSLGEFMGPVGNSSLPTAPRQRDPDDDGSFRRYPHRDDRVEREPSRSEQDSSWRRGRGAGGDDRGEPFDGGHDRERHDDRGGNWRGSGGGGGLKEDRGNRDDRGGSWRGGGNTRERNDERSGGWRGGSQNHSERTGDERSNWRSGGSSNYDRSDDRNTSWRGGSGSAKAPAERPRLQLKQRNTPKEEDASKPSQDGSINSNAGESALELSKLELSERENVVDVPEVSNNAHTTVAEEEKKQRGERRVREPEVINSRASALASDTVSNFCL